MGFLEVVSVAKGKVERITSNNAVWVYDVGIIDDFTRGIVSNYIGIDGAPETVMYGMGVTVDEIHLGVGPVPVENTKFYVELIVKEGRPAHVIYRCQAHKSLRIRNGGHSVYKSYRRRII